MTDALPPEQPQPDFEGARRTLGVLSQWNPARIYATEVLASAESEIARLRQDAKVMEAVRQEETRAIGALRDWCSNGGLPLEYVGRYQSVDEAVPAYVADLLAKLELAQADTERLDWLEAERGNAVLSDDGDRWAFSNVGMQEVPADEAVDMVTTFFVMKGQWKGSVREALDAAMQERK